MRWLQGFVPFLSVQVGSPSPDLYPYSERNAKQCTPELRRWSAGTGVTILASAHVCVIAISEAVSNIPV